MADVNLGEKIKDLYDLLSDMGAENRGKVVSAALALFGDIEITSKSKKGNSGDVEVENSSDLGSAKEFFGQKKPENKGELLAVAARYLELTEDKEVLVKEDFREAFKAARRNFDASNFSKDIGNAMNQAHFFIKGGKPRTYKLSFHGQEYVDALPDRSAAKSAKKSVTRKRKKKAAKKKSE